jgi:transposase
MQSTKEYSAAQSTLPDDLEMCHALIEELMATIRLQDREKAQLLHRVEHLLRQLYGRRSERIDPAQLLLFAEQAMQAVQEEASKEAPEVEQEPKTKRKGHGRKKPPASLPHIPLEHEVPEADKVCGQCACQKRRIGEKVSEQLEYAQASMFVIDHIQPVYACPCCEQGVVVAPKPAQPIEKGLPGPGLMAQVVVGKYCDHLPLYRQESIFERYGVYISRKTMWGWVLASAQMLEPVFECMKTCVLESKVLHTDDTPIDVRCRGQNYQGRFWVYLGDAGHPYTVYDYTPSRRRDGPIAFLKDFIGTQETPRFLQADAYGGYDGIFSAGNDVIEVACWAHTRRKYFDARTSDVVRAHQMLGWIKMLYQVEREAKDLDADARRALRQERSKPVLDEIEKWLEAQQGSLLPKSPIGEAVTYTRNQWKALNQYIGDGDLAIDNNVAENALRSIAIGRKNYLFIASDRGGWAAAILYSLIQSAKRHGLDPFLYLRDLFLRIPTHPNKEIRQLLPDHWKQEILPTLELLPRP